MCVYYARCTQLASHKLCIGSVMNMLKRDLGTGDLCDNIGLVVYLLSEAMSLHHLPIMTKPSLSCLLCFLCMLAIYIPLFKIRRIFDLLVSPPFLVLFRQVGTRVYMYNYYPKPALLPLLHPCPHCSSTRRFVTNVQELHCLSNCLHVFMISVRVWYHFTKFCCSTPAGSWDS